MKNNKKTIFISSIIVLAFALTLGFSHSAKSSPLDNVSGYAWGADDWNLAYDANSNGIQDGGELMPDINGMGWLSFNCIADGSCGTIGSNYGVNIDTVGNITGYAWTPNYGWLKFGGLTDFPIGNGTTTANAKLNTTTGAVTGWARFCSPTSNPALCSGTTTTSTFNGGWDGWVSLSGNDNSGTKPYGVTYNSTTKNFSGFAWGGNDNGKNVVGWIDFSHPGFMAPVSYNILGATAALTATSTTVVSGSSVYINWSSINTTSCVPTGGTANWTSTNPLPINSTAPGINSGPINTNTTFTLTCNGAISNLTVNVGSPLTFYAEPSPAYPPNYATTLYWSSKSNLYGCVASSSNNVAPSSAWNSSTVIADPVANHVPAYSQANVDVPKNTPTTQFDLSCFDAPTTPHNLVQAAPVYVTRGNLPESVSLTSNGVAGGVTRLSWTTVNVVANSCVASSDVSGDWNQTKYNYDSGDGSTGSGHEDNVPVSSDAPAFNTYNLTCTSLYHSPSTITATIQLNTSSTQVTNKKAPHYVEQ